MNGTILLAIDHTSSAKRTAAMARALASSGGSVTVVHVHQVATAPWGPIVVDDKPEDDCIAELVARDLQSSGVTAEHKVVQAPMGRVGGAIAVAAERLDAAMIIMGTHGESDLESMTLGSTSHRVLHRANRPVLLVPSD